MVVSTFSVLDKDEKKRFFKVSFLLANVNPDIVLGILFFIMSNANIDFQAQDLQWRSYITEDVFLITRQVELTKKKKFLATAFNSEHKAFIVYVAAFSVDLSDKIHLLRRTWIAQLKADKASTKISCKYADFVDVFSSKLAVELFKHIRINDHTIELVDD